MQDPRYTALKRKIERAFQAFRKRVTGAQASDKELRMLRPLLARVQDRPGIFFETINDLIREGRNAYRDRLNLYQAAGRDIRQFEQILQGITGETPTEASPERPPTKTPINRGGDLDNQINALLDTLGG